MITASPHHRSESTTARPTTLLSRLVLATAVGVTLLVSGCAVSVPSDVRPVTGFNVERYAGTWYELARIDHRFEKGLINTSAEYTLKPDGTVKVVNRGFNPEKNAWKSAEGTAKFLDDPRTAALKVSFFGPFYAGYNVVYLSDDYTTAMVIGDKMDYFWLLSRSKQIPPAQRQLLLAKAASLGVDVNQVIDVPQR